MVLLDPGAGRRLALRVGHRSETGHDGALHQPHGGIGGGPHGHAAGAGRGPHQVPQRSWLGVHGAGFEGHLRVLEIRHIYCAPHHPQTNRKIEPFHETLKAHMNLLVYTGSGRAAANQLC
jgi:hypothetical protein